MNTKNMTKEEALKTIEFLKKRIEFNNKLNAFVRKFRKEQGVHSPYEQGKSVENGFNGYWDEPTQEMKDAMKDILVNNSIEDLSWMSTSLKQEYARDTNHIFGQVYSCAVNTYILKDLHDCEKYVQTFDNAIESGNEENELFSVERDTTNNRLNLHFDYIPDEETRTVLKHRGFKWSPKFSCWTRQLTDNAEKSLELVKSDLHIN